MTKISGVPVSNVRDVPYFAQWESSELVPDFLSGALPAGDDPRWGQSGADTREEYEFWSWRACGVACLRMLLAFWNGTAPAAMPLVRECRDAGAYVVDGDKVHGLIYAPFCNYLGERWNLDAQIISGVTSREVAESLSPDSFVILSVHPSIRRPIGTPPERGGHLVVVVGTTPDGLAIHNPSGLPDSSQSFAKLSHETMARYFAGRGMVISRR